MENDERVRIGVRMLAAMNTGVWDVEDAETALRDGLAYLAHVANALGLEPDVVFEHGLTSYEGDREDGPYATPVDYRGEPFRELQYALFQVTVPDEEGGTK